MKSLSLVIGTINDIHDKRELQFPVNPKVPPIIILLDFDCGLSNLPGNRIATSSLYPNSPAPGTDHIRPQSLDRGGPSVVNTKSKHCSNTFEW